MTPTLTHIALHVEDIDACRRFYEQLCELQVVHTRTADKGGGKVLWMAEPGREQEFVFVLIAGGTRATPAARNYGHLGFAMGSREAVDRVADKARQLAALRWEPREEPYPVGYYCGVSDPNGTMIEFSYGQPLGPGSDAGAE